MKMEMRVQAHGQASAKARRSGSRQLTAPRAIAIGMLALTWTASFSSARADAVAAGAQRLLDEYKCYICHSDHEAKAGPAYADVAAQFRAKRNAVSQIAAEIRRGIHGGGPWHMPPHPEVSPADARIMARYILSLDPASTASARR